MINNDDLCDLVRDLALTKGQAELLGSRLKEFNLLSPGTRTSQFRHRRKELVQFFAMSDNMCYCTDIQGLMSSLGVEHSTEAWRLFIDSSKASLKAVLLHNGNMYASVPVGYYSHLKETYETMSLLLEKIRYRDYNWNICGDLKVITILMGMQTGYTKYCCFICEWDRRDRKHHYIKKNWPIRDNPSKLDICYKQPQYTLNWELSLYSFDNEVFEMPKLEFNAEILMSTSQYMVLPKMVGIFGEFITIDASKNKVVFRQCGDTTSAAMTLEEDESKEVEINVLTDIKKEMAMKYITIIGKVANLCSKVKLHMGYETPIFFDFSIYDLGHMRYYIAPKTESDY